MTPHLCLQYRHAYVISFSCGFQGYERVRRNSEEEVYLLRGHDMEEGSGHSDLSSSGVHDSEEVSTAR